LCSLVKLYEPLCGNMRSANKLLLTKQAAINRTQVSKLMGSAIVHLIRSKGLEYTSKQYHSQRNSRCLQNSIEDTSFFIAYFE